MTHTIWITGAAGFIGANAVRHFTKAGWRVVGFDRQRPDANLPSTAFHVAPIEGWILDAALAAHGKPDVVFHAAGTGTVGRAQADPGACHADTVQTTEILIGTLSRAAPGARLIYPSSAAVYGNAKLDVIPETAPVAPISVYGQNKILAEKLCENAAHTGQISTAVIRFFSVYGPGLKKQLPWELGQKMLTAPDPITLFGSGAETRDFLHIDDAIGLIHHLADHKPAPPLVVNGGTGIATRIGAFAEKLGVALGKPRAIAFSGEVKANDPVHMRADISRLNSIGFQAKVSLDTGLKSYADWILHG